MRTLCLAVYLSTTLLNAHAQTEFTSHDWKVRAKAFFELNQSGAASKADRRQTYIDLLARENGLINATLASTGGAKGVSAVLGESFSEYYSALFGVVAQFAKSGDDKAAMTLAAGAFSSDSETAKLMVEKWATTLPVFLQTSRENQVKVAQADEMVGKIVSLKRAQLNPGQIAAIKARLQVDLFDRSALVRSAAVASVATSGLTELAPSLEKVASMDPATDRAGKVPRYPVRELALKALQTLDLK